MRSIPRRIFIAAIVLYAFVGLLGIVSLSHAQEQACACFCTSPEGARRKPDNNTELTLSQCELTCDDQGESIAAFACTANQYPDRTPNCFSEEECRKYKGVFDSFQPPECTAGYHYCYPNPSDAEKATLSTSIGGLSITGDLGEYVANGYKWLIGIATTIAIVFIMIAGLRWAFGGLSAEQIGKAKAMIRNAVTGLALLLSTYLILFTVNPQLLTLHVPDFPLVKTINVVGVASCSELIHDKYKVEFNGPEECGTVGTVVEDPKGNAVPDGTTCNFTQCPDAGWEKCIPGEKPTCMKCEQMTRNNNVLKPTPELCDSFNTLDNYGRFTNTSNEVLSFNKCFFSFDGDVGGNYLDGACARIKMDCLGSNYGIGGIRECADYDHVPVFYGTNGQHTQLDNLDVGANSGIVGDTSILSQDLYNVGVTLGSFCSQSKFADLCKWTRRDPEISCRIDSNWTDPLNPFSSSGMFNYFQLRSYDCEADK